jgi:hypothetical protein
VCAEYAHRLLGAVVELDGEVRVSNSVRVHVCIYYLLLFYRSHTPAGWSELDLGTVLYE